MQIVASSLPHGPPAPAPYHIGCRPRPQVRPHGRAPRTVTVKRTAAVEDRRRRPRSRSESATRPGKRPFRLDAKAPGTPCRWIIRIPCHRTVTRQDGMDRSPIGYPYPSPVHHGLALDLARIRVFNFILACTNRSTSSRAKVRSVCRG